MQDTRDVLSFYSQWIFLTLIAIEAFLIWHSGRKYSWRENIASFAINVGQIVMAQLFVKAFNLSILTAV
jgi:uncharacterized membrane protein